MDIEKLYERAWKIKFRVSLTLIALNSGGVLTALNYSTKITQNFLLKFIGSSILVLVCGILFGVLSLWLLFSKEESEIQNIYAEELESLSAVGTQKSGHKTQGNVSEHDQKYYLSINKASKKIQALANQKIKKFIITYKLFLSLGLLCFGPGLPKLRPGATLIFLGQRDANATPCRDHSH